MKLQVALDTLSVKDSIELTKDIQDYVDIIELGTPFVVTEGLHIVKKFRKLFPNKEILADLKIMDGGYYEANAAFEAAANYVTVLSVTDNLTIEGCVKAAREHHQQVVCDMMCCNNLSSRIGGLEKLGVQMLAVHTGADQQNVGRTPLKDLAELKSQAKTAAVSVAGGINQETIESYVALKPDVIIVGSGICNQVDPKKEAKIIKSRML